MHPLSLSLSLSHTHTHAYRPCRGADLEEVEGRGVEKPERISSTERLFLIECVGRTDLEKVEGGVVEEPERDAPALSLSFLSLSLSLSLSQTHTHTRIQSLKGDIPQRGRR